MLRAVAAVAVLIIAALLAYAVVAPRWHCDIALTRIDAQTEEISKHPDSLRVYPIARANIQRLRSCIDTAPENIEARMLLAANYVALDRKQEAAAAYRAALQYDRRPELFFSLGCVELDLNERDAAMRDLVAAATFNPNVIEEIQYPEIQQAVFNDVRRHQNEILARSGERR